MTSPATNRAYLFHFQYGQEYTCLEFFTFSSLMKAQTRNPITNINQKSHLPIVCWSSAKPVWILLNGSEKNGQHEDDCTYPSDPAANTLQMFFQCFHSNPKPRIGSVSTKSESRMIASMRGIWLPAFGQVHLNSELVEYSLPLREIHKIHEFLQLLWGHSA